VNPVTGKNWEGVGVKSDVVAGAGVWEGVTDGREVGIRMAATELGVRRNV
jgi:hypothetical protein